MPVGYCALRAAELEQCSPKSPLVCNIECRNNGGSHHVFGFPNVEMDVTVPAHRPIKPVYIRQFLLLVDAVKELKK